MDFRYFDSERNVVIIQSHPIASTRFASRFVWIFVWIFHLARTSNRLAPLFVSRIKEPGIHADGGGLYFSTLRSSRRWIFVFRWQGKRREFALGSYPAISLARARELATEARQMVASGINPVDARKAQRDSSSTDAGRLTFEKFAEEYISSVETGWRNAVHRQQWRNTLRDYAGPLARKTVADIDTDDVLAVLQPIWLEKPETASRVRGRIEKVLAAAKARGIRPRESINPATWRGHLDVLLPRRPRLSRGHHAAMPYEELPQFMARLAHRPAIAARALEFAILTASRSGEVLGASWAEINGDRWTVPADRMKAGVTHTVTLSASAIELLERIGPGKPEDLVFAGRSADRQLSNMSMAMLMRRMKVGQFTVHGFRSSFKDWALNCTEFPDELSEEALAHIIGSKVRRAYRRGEALERRRKLMDAWATYLTASQRGDDLEQLL